MNAKIIQYPFTSDSFIQAWKIWKQYKKESFKFNYKPIGEQAALMHLAKLSGNNEELAIEIINTSMGNGWKGFFALNNNFNNGKTQPSKHDNIRNALAEAERLDREQNLSDTYTD
jgi:hypothetical protein